MSCNVCRMSFNLYFPQGHLIVCIQTYAHTHTYKTVVMRSLDVEPRRQTDRQSNRQGDTQTEGTKQQNRIRSWVGSVFFFPLLSAVPLKCACSCKQIFRSSNSANNCNERRRSRRRSAQRATSSVSAAAGELSLNLLTNQYQCQYTRTPAHTVCMGIHIHTHADARIPAVAVVWQRHTNYGN